MAGDEESVAYLYDWVNQNLEDKDLLKTMGYSGRIDSSRVGERSFRSLGINWSKLGINAHYASVSVIRYEVDRDDFMNPDNIKAIRFGEGRNSLILKLDPTFRTESLGGGTNRSEVQVVNDKASVYCD